MCILGTYVYVCERVSECVCVCVCVCVCMWADMGEGGELIKQRWETKKTSHSISMLCLIQITIAVKVEIQYRKHS